jgi:hypothetical protein
VNGRSAAGRFDDGDVDGTAALHLADKWRDSNNDLVLAQTQL